MSSELVLSVSDFVAICNQTLDYAYPLVAIVGEVANFRVSKNRWVYFDLKDETASVKFFGTVYQLSGPLEDGLLLQVTGSPRLHPLYGFSITIQSMLPVGEGSLKRASALLEAKLRAEGLFDDQRKRPLPYPPQRVGLITSGNSAAHHDFVKIINQRWGGVVVELADIQVQGEPSPSQIIAALEYFNTHEAPVDVVVITRGGGSAEDLAAFNHEQVTRAVAASRIPTLIAIGHEIDVSLAELAADQRASTPSNAAELLVPDKRHVLEQLEVTRASMGNYLHRNVSQAQSALEVRIQGLTQAMEQYLQDLGTQLGLRQQVLAALSPAAALKRGYAIIRSENKAVSSVKQLQKGAVVTLQLRDGRAAATITDTTGDKAA